MGCSQWVLKIIKMRHCMTNGSYQHLVESLPRKISGCSRRKKGDVLGINMMYLLKWTLSAHESMLMVLLNMILKLQHP